MRIYDDITKTIGNTPLVKLQRLNQGHAATLLLKLEFFNPLGSVKDRIGINMIELAESRGQLKPGMEIIEPTSGNTGVALAFVAAAKGYPLTLVMPETMSIERRTLLLLLGANVVLTPGPLGMRGAIAKVRELAQGQTNVFIPSQFDNDANPDIHRRTTANEIWEDTDGKVDMVVCGIGTGGTATGVGEVLKQKNPNIKIIAVEPTESAVISGDKPGPHKIQGIGAGFIPKNLNLAVVDEVIKVDSDAAIQMARRVIKQEGIPVGISSGAALVAGFELADKPENKGKLIVVVIPSYSERYLSTALAEAERKRAGELVVEQIEEAYLS